MQSWSGIKFAIETDHPDNISQAEMLGGRLFIHGDGDRLTSKCKIRNSASRPVAVAVSKLLKLLNTHSLSTLPFTPHS
jgi:hypothetical protein